MCVSAISFNFSLPLLWRHPAFYFPPSNAFNSQIPRFLWEKPIRFINSSPLLLLLAFPYLFIKVSPFLKKACFTPKL